MILMTGNCYYYWINTNRKIYKGVMYSNSKKNGESKT